MESDFCLEQQVPLAVLAGISFGIATEVEKEKLAVRTINTANEVADPALGLPSPSSECSTCRAEDLKSCEGHFGVIKFPFTILNPHFISEVVKVLNNICPGCKSVRKDLVVKKGADLASSENVPKGCKYCKPTMTGWYPRMKFTNYKKSGILVEIIEKPARKNLKPGFNQELADDFWDIIPKDEHQDENDITPHKRRLTHAQVHHLLKDVNPNFIGRFSPKITSIFLNSFPVTPNNQRVTELFSNGQRLVFDERTRAYRKLIDFKGTANELSSRVLDCLKASKLTTDRSFDDTLQKRSESEETGLRWFKVSVLAKRNDHSFRMVVVGDPKLKLDEVGIPFQIAERMHIAEHLTPWNSRKLTACCDVRLLEKGDMHVRREGSLVRIRCIDELRIGDIIFRSLSDGDKVLINRPPSIHKHSFISFSVKVIPETSTLAINPLCCGPFHGDFDGDCLHGYVPQSVDTRVELKELVALDKQLTNAQNGCNLIGLSQDSLAAAHLILEDQVLLNKFQVQQLAMFCPQNLPVSSIVKAPSVKGCAWTGQQVISMLLPRGFDYDNPLANVRIRDGEVITSEGSSWLRDTDNLFQSIVRSFPNLCLDFLHATQEVLCEWLSTRGLSVSLADLYLTSDSYTRESMMEEIWYALKEAEHACDVKQLMVHSCRDILAGNSEDDQLAVICDEHRLCYEKQRSATLSQTLVEAFKNVFRDIQSLYYHYAGKDNSLLAMFKAGSKGNLLKLVQHSMCLGIQQSLIPLSFRMPRQLSFVEWNKLKSTAMVECARNFIPSAVIGSSFLEGLNPLECFVHSTTSRDSSFSDNADVPGTLNRKLMFFLRDICAAYDGTVRNSYGNQVVQFSYAEHSDKVSSGGNVNEDHGMSGGEPVGSLAACALSEAAYSALDQPISLLEKSPLLTLKNILECGLKKRAAHQTVTLFLSEKLEKQRHGFVYGALEVQNHLERLRFSDVVSSVRIMYTTQSNDTMHLSPWVCHFHVYKEILKKRNLTLRSIINTLSSQSKSKGDRLVQISCKDFLVANSWKEKEETCCITVTVVETNWSSSTPLETIQDRLIPQLLDAVIKGFMEIDKVEILWNDKPKITKSCRGPRGELYLRVSISTDSGKTRPWNLLLNDCLQIMDMIDWDRSHPNNVHDFCLAFGIDAGLKFFLNNLELAISDVGKTILPQHLLLLASCLSVTGEFVGLSPRGFKEQQETATSSSPFVQACFSNPGTCFLKAAKAEATDTLQGSLDALAWGKMPAAIGAGQFDIVYSGKGNEFSEPIDVYNLLGSEARPAEQQNEFELRNAQSLNPENIRPPIVFKFADCGLEELKMLQKKRSILSRCISYSDILSLSRWIRNILHRYPPDHELNETDKAIVITALFFHPRRNEKIGIGAQGIKVTSPPDYEETRCFAVVRSDGTSETFSYHKCIHAALEIIHPRGANKYHQKYIAKRYRT